ncbi:AAA family ATPase [Acidothermaceae bacterium B102]|nr:AAA family ATPase [Acidothermaceae bacterium B102]
MDLLEREAQLDTLDAVWKSVPHRSGRVVVVEGAAGHGKSALLAESLDNAASNGLRVLRARGSELERGQAFGAIRQLFEQAVGRLTPDERAEVFAGAAAPAAHVVAPELMRAERPATMSEYGVLHGIYWLATNLAEQGPMVLAVDDLHWVDASSVRALCYLALRIADLRIALVVTLRPAEPGGGQELMDQLGAQPEAVRITVPSLGLASVADLVRAARPGADDDLCAACFSATAGNPFYLRELLISLSGADASRNAVVSDLALPILGQHVLRRLAPIGAGVVRLARTMAVLDEGSRLDDAARLADLDATTAARMATAMQRIEVLAAVDPVAFVHPLIRRSLYDTLSVVERDAAHLAAARHFQTTAAPYETVAAHMAAARPDGRVEVATALSDAAEEALRHGAPQVASVWLERALAEEAAEPSRAVLLHQLGRIEVAARGPSGLGFLREAMALETHPALRGTIAIDLAELCMAAGQWHEGLTTIDTALRELDGSRSDTAVDLDAFLALIRAYDPGLVQEFDEDRARLLALAEGDAWSQRAIAVLVANIDVLRGQSLGPAGVLVEHGLRDWQLFREHDAGGWASAQALMALVLLDQDERALEACDALETMSRRSGSLIGVLTAAGYRGWLHSRRGDLASAEAQLRAGLVYSMQSQMSLLVVTAVAFLSEAMLERSSLDDIVALVESIEITPDFARTGGGALLLTTRGRLRAARGQREQAAADLRAVAEVFGPLGFGPPFTFWRSELAIVLHASEPAEATTLVTDELALAHATGVPWAPAVTLRAAGTLAGGSAGLEQLRRSVELLAASAATLEHARSLVEYGAALRRDGQRIQAREALSAGAELAYRCGADRLSARAMGELRATGARPRRVVRTGVDALTVSELRAARLVADGHSNADVAQSLFVSLKTVETHLSHVYAKLGLSGPTARRDLAEALEQPANLRGAP